MKIILNIYSAIVIAVVLLFVLFPACLVVVPFKSAQKRLQLTAPFWEIFFKSFTYVACLAKVYAEDHRPEDVKKMQTPKGLYISNHQSFLDIPLSLSFFRIPPIMKKSILYIPFFGVCGYSSGALIVDRSNRNSRKKVFELSQRRLLEGMQALHFYPEGTRNKKGHRPKDVSEIKKPIIKFAYENNVPVYTTTMFGTYKVFRGRLVNHFQKVGIIIRDAMMPSDYENADEFIKAVWAQVNKDYDALEGKLS
jgi:1-acyl-sn-glycerol-3-phosphate acyltransferase